MSTALLAVTITTILFSVCFSAPARHEVERKQGTTARRVACMPQSQATDLVRATVVPTPNSNPTTVPFATPITASTYPQSSVPGNNGSASGNSGKPTFPVQFKEPLLPNIYTADPSAHVINGKLYVICSTDDPKENYPDPNEMHFLMTRYTIMSFNEDLTQVTDEGEVLPLATVPWADKQLWAPDFTCQGSNCFLYFPAKAKDGIFRIGAATSTTGPTGPYKAQENYIQGTYSVDPAVFVDDDKSSWLIWGGEWGGQLENWQTGQWDPNAQRPTSGSCLSPRLAKLKPNMLEIETVQKISIVDSNGMEIQASDYNRKFFEASWIHKAGATYYLTYSTGENHLLVYATSDKVTGPYTFQGELMSPPVGWTTHESIVKYGNRTYLFYHDSKTSGQTNLRQVKFQPLEYDANGHIIQVSP